MRINNDCLGAEVMRGEILSIPPWMPACIAGMAAVCVAVLMKAIGFDRTLECVTDIGTSETAISVFGFEQRSGAQACWMAVGLRGCAAGAPALPAALHQQSFAFAARGYSQATFYVAVKKILVFYGVHKGLCFQKCLCSSALG